MLYNHQDRRRCLVYLHQFNVFFGCNSFCGRSCQEITEIKVMGTDDIELKYTTGRCLLDK